MIKTHKPRGHFWTCASVFQQSKEIRNINFEDCTPPDAEILAPDSDDELRPSERAAKRRRIEKLADDFLNGADLVITSARLRPESLKSAVEWNERSRRGEKWSLPAVQNPGDDGQLWVDAEDPWEALQKSCQKRKTKGKGKSRVNRIEQRPEHTSAQAETVTEVQEATSGCKSTRQRRPKLSTEPSTDAVKQAAVLRARRLQRATTEGLDLSDDRRQSVPDTDAAESLSAPASIARPRYFRNRKPGGTEWLLRHNTTLYELSPDESFDELSRSGIGTPSRILHQSATQQRPTSPRDAEQPSDAVPASHLENHLRQPARAEHRDKHQLEPVDAFKSSADPLSLSFSQKLAAAAHSVPSASSATVSFHTASEDAESDPTPVQAIAQGDSQADSRSQLLKRQGIHAAPRKSWAPVNEPALTASVEPSPIAAADEQPASSKASLICQSVQESAQDAGKPKKGKRTKSAGNDAPQVAAPSTRRRSAPTESQCAPEQVASLSDEQQRHGSAARGSTDKPAYTEVQPAPQGETPFMFRKKRTSKADDGQISAEPTAKQEKKGRKRIIFTSSENARAGGVQVKVPTKAVSGEPPMLDMTLSHDSSFGMKLNMALVDEHLNAVLPNEPGSSRRSSAVKRALRQELQKSGAEVTRIPGEPLSSQIGSQGGPTVAGLGDGHEDQAEAEEGLKHAQELSKQDLQDSLRLCEEDGRRSLRSAIEVARRESTEGQSAQPQWPGGTQAMLYQAQRDLFMSPEKRTAIDQTSANATPEPSEATAVLPADSAFRPPPRELSQEQLPSTQAMMDGWSPWTAMKKLKATTAQPAEPSPTTRRNNTAKRRQSARLSSSAPDPTIAMDDTARRRSSLRFSISTSDSPAPSSRLNFPVVKPSSSDEAGKRASSGSVPAFKPILKDAGTPRQSPQREMPLTWDPTTMVSFDTIQSESTHASSNDPPMLSSEAGQGPLMREESLNRTINELTADVLNTNDMDGMLS